MRTSFNNNAPAMLGHELQTLNVILNREKIVPITILIKDEADRGNMYLDEDDKNRILWPYTI